MDIKLNYILKLSRFITIHLNESPLASADLNLLLHFKQAIPALFDSLLYQLSDPMYALRISAQFRYFVLDGSAFLRPLVALNHLFELIDFLFYLGFVFAAGELGQLLL